MRSNYEVLTASPEALLDYQIFPGGVHVAVPVLPEETQQDSGLPEWRR